MPASSGAAWGALVSTPLALTLAGVLAALLVVGIVMAWRRANGHLLAPLAALLLATLAVAALIDRFALAQHAAERRALIDRAAALDRSALLSGSALPAWMPAPARRSRTPARRRCSPRRRPPPRRSPIWARGCNYCKTAPLLPTTRTWPQRLPPAAAPSSSTATASRRKCWRAATAAPPRNAPPSPSSPIADALKANLKAQVFQQYVSRYAAGWNAPAAMRPGVRGAGQSNAVKPGEHWDFPSAASIPPVNIMNAEPPPPKTDAAAAQAPTAKPAAADAKPAAAGAASPPLPRNRPAVTAKPPLSISGGGN